MQTMHSEQQTTQFMSASDAMPREGQSHNSLSKAIRKAVRLPDQSPLFVEHTTLLEYSKSSNNALSCRLSLSAGGGSGSLQLLQGCHNVGRRGALPRLWVSALIDQVRDLLRTVLGHPAKIPGLFLIP